MTSIEWTDKTWNPVLGCSRISPGCEHCYAEGLVHRGMTERHRGLTVLPKDKTGKSLGKGARWTGEVRMVPEVLDVPLRRLVPTTWFVNSLSDLFHERLVDDEAGRRFIAAVFGVMAATPQHTYQILTKRPERAREWFAWLESNFDAMSPHLGPVSAATRSATALTEIVDALTVHGVAPARLQRLTNTNELVKAWPLPNVWIGASVEDQKRADDRIPALLKVPAAVRFLSCEPLLGPVDLGQWLGSGGTRDCQISEGDGVLAADIDGYELAGYRTIHWVIVGGESGHGARPMHPCWARSLRDQCVGHRVALLFKQWGEWAPEVDAGPNRGPKLIMASNGLTVDAGRNGVPCVLPVDNFTINGRLALEGEPDRVTMARVGKKAAGRRLDGRSWDEFPA